MVARDGPVPRHAGLAVEQRFDDDEDGAEEDLGPGDADYDLTEEHGYMWEPPSRWRLRPWMLAVIAVLLIVSLILPTALYAWQYR